MANGNEGLSTNENNWRRAQTYPRLLNGPSFRSNFPERPSLSTPTPQTRNPTPSCGSSNYTFSRLPIPGTRPPNRDCQRSEIVPSLNNPTIPTNDPPETSQSSAPPYPYHGCSLGNLVLHEIRLLSDNQLVQYEKLNSAFLRLESRIKNLKEQVCQPSPNNSNPGVHQIRRSRGSSGKHPSKNQSGKMSDEEMTMKKIQEQLSEKLVGDDIYRFFRHFYNRNNLEQVIRQLEALDSDYKRVNRCFAELNQHDKDSFNPSLIKQRLNDMGLLECERLIEHLHEEEINLTPIENSNDYLEETSQPSPFYRSVSSSTCSFETIGVYQSSEELQDQESPRREARSDSVFETT